MLLDLSRLRGARERVERTWPATSFDSTDDFVVSSPVTFEADIHKDKQIYRIVGRAAATLELTCSRCVEPFRVPVEASFDLRYVPHLENTGLRAEGAPGEKLRGKGAHGESDEGQEVEEDDLTTAFYRDETIDLSELVREQFYLALPMKPLCAEACKGLCAQCGTNLNQGTCDCRPEWQDPRFEALKALKKE
jgi:uncharacterized protein